MMDLRKRLFIIFGLLILLIVVIVLVVLAPWQQDEEDSVIPAEDDDIDEFVDSTLDLAPFVGDPGTISPILANEDADERYVRQLAIDFVERFGSFSNQNRNTHINDVLPLVTDGMAGWVGQQLQAYSDEYNGSTTNVIVSNVESFGDGKASISIQAQQVLETQTDTERVYNTGNVTLELVDNTWKVSGLFWE